jgi:hypothetical protein
VREVERGVGRSIVRQPTRFQFDQFVQGHPRPTGRGATLGPRPAGLWKNQRVTLRSRARRRNGSRNDTYRRDNSAPSVPHQPWPSCVIFQAWLSRRQRCAEYPKPWWHTPNACVRMRSGRARMAFSAESTRLPHGSPPSSGAFIPKLRKIARTPADHCRRTDNGNADTIPGAQLPWRVGQELRH